MSDMKDIERLGLRHPAVWIVASTLNKHSRRTMHVHDIAKCTMFAEEHVTRTINNYCPDAADYNHGKPAYFHRVEPATYMLTEMPLLADLWNSKGRVEREDFPTHGHHYYWEKFCEIASKRDKNFKERPLYERLSAYAGNFDKFKGHVRAYNETLDSIEIPLGKDGHS